MTGYIAVHRSVFDHDLFAREPFSRRDAWLWLIGAAVWQPTRVMVRSGQASEFINLERGQLSHSDRFLAEKWKWSRTAVRTFLRLLQTEQMILQKQDRLQNLITICNYDEYQNWQPQTRPALNQHETSTEPKKNNLEEVIRKEGTPAGAPEDTVVNLYAFHGRVIRIKPDQFERWRKTYESIELRDELALADDYYFENPTKDGKWFFQAASWLDRSNKRARAIKKSELRARGDAW